MNLWLYEGLASPETEEIEIVFHGFTFSNANLNDEKIFWKCEHARKYACHGRLHTDLSNVFIKTVGDHENHTGNPRSGLIRQYYERLQGESQQNQTNPHNILTQTNIGVPDEVHIQLPSNENLKRNIRRWRQEDNAVSTPTNINFPIIPNKYHRTTRDTIFFRIDTGPGSNRLLIFFTDEQQNIMENATAHWDPKREESDPRHEQSSPGHEQNSPGHEESGGCCVQQLSML
ncbi:unnamed protein product [Didymodactylos carnosus]|uniref:FLYWCH-type domain-containing protein n=1 Tax=Didymodactylos carnosus TaxID=1234261 RepID=A0A8S2E8I4_9BILA|nr:unnamed protein product [Didymodactylos carnosus]CAF3964326.1 unnamed protein product [Didymodactylos carnosus]